MKSSSSNLPQKQHYVPQVYLKNFAIRKNKIWETYAFDKKNDKSYFADIKSVAMEKDFYTIKNGEDAYIWERFYANGIEPVMGKVFSKLIQRSNCIFVKNGDIVLDDESISDLSVIIVMQLLRTPKSRIFQFEIAQGVVPRVIKDAYNTYKSKLSSQEKNKLSNFKMTDELFRQLDMPIINNPDRIVKFANTLINKIWILYKISDHTKNSFVTSDHPVCMYNLSKKSTDLGDTGIGNPNTIILYPISSQLILSLYDYSTFFLKDLYHGRLIEVDAESELNFIKFINSLQYRQSIQHVFCRPLHSSIPGLNNN